MIRPHIHPLSPEYQKGLIKLLAECGYPEAASHTWDPKRSLVAVKDGEVVGFATVIYDGSHFGAVDWVIVTPKLRSMGIGIFLLMQAIRVLQGKGITNIQIMTRKPEVIDMVTRLGFGETEHSYRSFVLDTSKDRPTHA